MLNQLLSQICELTVSALVWRGASGPSQYAILTNTVEQYYVRREVFPYVAKVAFRR